MRLWFMVKSRNRVLPFLQLSEKTTVQTLCMQLKSDGTKELNVVVETKLVENKSTLRGTENAKIKCAETFFKQLTIDGYKVSFHTQLSNKKVKQIIEEVIIYIMRKTTQKV